MIMDGGGADILEVAADSESEVELEVNVIFKWERKRLSFSRRDEEQKKLDMKVEAQPLEREKRPSPLGQGYLNWGTG